MDAYLAGWRRPRTPATTCAEIALGGLVLRLAGWTPRSTSGWTRSAPRRRRRCAARPRIANARLAYGAYQEVFAGARCGRRSAARRRPAAAARCGPRPASRTPTTPTRMYVTDLVAAAHASTRCRRRRSDAVADHGEITGDTIAPARTRRPRASSTRSARSASTYATWSTVLEDEGVDKFVKSWAGAAGRDDRGAAASARQDSER